MLSVLTWPLTFASGFIRADLGKDQNNNWVPTRFPEGGDSFQTGPDVGFVLVVCL